MTVPARPGVTRRALAKGALLTAGVIAAKADPSAAHIHPGGLGMQHAPWRPDDDEDIALVNGNILTLDGRNTIANSVAIRGDRIVDIGNGRHVRPCKQTIDLRGATVIACMPQAGSPRWRISRGTSHEECNQQGVSATPDPTRLGSIVAQWQTLSGRARVAKPAMN